MNHLWSVGSASGRREHISNAWTRVAPMAGAAALYWSIRAQVMMWDALFVEFYYPALSDETT